MLNKLCIWTNSRDGQLVLGIATLVGGLHLIMTEPQPLLSFIPWNPTITVMGKELGAQTLVGMVLTVAGGCWVWDFCCADEEIEIEVI